MCPLNSSFTTTLLHIIVSVILQGREKLRKSLMATQQVCGSADVARECRLVITVPFSMEARGAATQRARARSKERGARSESESESERRCRGRSRQGPEQVEPRRS